MSADDIVARASRALCEQAQAPAPEASETRARVLSRVSRRIGRGKVVVALAPLAAVLAVSAAWASQREGLARVCSQVEMFVSPEGWRPRGDASHGRVPVVVPVTNAPEVSIISPEPRAGQVPEIPFEALPLAPATDAPSNRPRLALPATPPPARELPAQVAAPVADLASRLYAEAHHAHFVERDPEAALRAWDAYLREAPGGPLAPEARYNRALALVRLGRGEEARQALAPFAGGAYGQYRTSEARQLVDALRGR